MSLRLSWLISDNWNRQRGLSRIACPRYRAAILLACDAGLRAGEVRSLRWSDINELRRELTVRRSLDKKGRETPTKNWKDRHLPQEEADDAAKEVRKGYMPPNSYLSTHPEAKLSAAESELLVQGLEALRGASENDDDDDDV